MTYQKTPRARARGSSSLVNASRFASPDVCLLNHFAISIDLSKSWNYANVGYQIKGFNVLYTFVLLIFKLVPRYWRYDFQSVGPCAGVLQPPDSLIPMQNKSDLCISLVCLLTA